MAEMLAKTLSPDQVCPSATVRARASLATFFHLEKGQKHVVWTCPTFRCLC